MKQTNESNNYSNSLGKLARQINGNSTFDKDIIRKVTGR